MLRKMIKESKGYLNLVLRYCVAAHLTGRQVSGRACLSRKHVYKSPEALNNMTYLGNCKPLGVTAA